MTVTRRARPTTQKERPAADRKVPAWTSPGIPVPNVRSQARRLRRSTSVRTELTADLGTERDRRIAQIAIRPRGRISIEGPRILTLARSPDRTDKYMQANSTTRIASGIVKATTTWLVTDDRRA